MLSWFPVLVNYCSRRGSVQVLCKAAQLWGLLSPPHRHSSGLPNTLVCCYLNCPKAPRFVPQHFNQSLVLEYPSMSGISILQGSKTCTWIRARMLLYVCSAYWIVNPLRPGNESFSSLYTIHRSISEKWIKILVFLTVALFSDSING